MNWLVKCFATIECKKKRVRFHLHGQEIFYFQCERKVISSLIASSQVNKSIRASKLIFLAKLEVSKRVNDDINYIIIVNEFLNIFSKKWDSLSPKRKVEISIDIQKKDDNY